jgi:hypothetical protein
VAASRRSHRLPPLRLQLRVLFKRSWRQVTRDKAAIKLRVITNMQSAVTFGIIWWRLRRVQQAIASRIGLLQVCTCRMDHSACVLAACMLKHAPGGFQLLSAALAHAGAEFSTSAASHNMLGDIGRTSRRSSRCT